jgi:inositol-pentakisphosphate 2-kinase
MRVQIPSSTHLSSETDLQARIDIRLGDLDLKSAANGKAEYWLNIEKRLIDEGWYIGAQSSQAGTNGECVLSR